MAGPRSPLLAEDPPAPVPESSLHPRPPARLWLLYMRTLSHYNLCLIKLISGNLFLKYFDTERYLVPCTKDPRHNVHTLHNLDLYGTKVSVATHHWPQ